jgi:uncharacterized protein DUF2460
VRFLDGTEQRYRDSAGALHRWQIRFDKLNEFEVSAIEDFFAEAQGTYESFAFIDPWDGEEYANCRLESDGLDVVTLSEMDAGTSVIVVENR